MRSLLIFTFFFLTKLLIAQQFSWSDEKIIVTANGTKNTLLHVEKIFADRWDELAQTIFCQKIMLLSPDTCIINVASTRQILGYMSVKN